MLSFLFLEIAMLIWMSTRPFATDADLTEQQTGCLVLHPVLVRADHTDCGHLTRAQRVLLHDIDAAHQHQTVHGLGLWHARQTRLRRARPAKRGSSCC